MVAICLGVIFDRTSGRALTILMIAGPLFTAVIWSVLSQLLPFLARISPLVAYGDQLLGHELFQPFRVDPVRQMHSAGWIVYAKIPIFVAGPFQPQKPVGWVC